MKIHDLKVLLFADGADLTSIAELASTSVISGFTTNPSLMRKAGVRDYLEFAKEASRLVGTRPISLEVIADDFQEMERQAMRLAELGPNVFVKIPVTTTRGDYSYSLVRCLVDKGVQVNVTAICTAQQAQAAAIALEAEKTRGYVSVFAGRIADTGVDPSPLIERLVSSCPANVQVIWASPREPYNVVEANRIGCHIITVFPEILRKLELLGRDLNQHSLDTVRMFYDDACQSGYTL